MQAAEISNVLFQKTFTEPLLSDIDDIKLISSDEWKLVSTLDPLVRRAK